MVLRRDIPVLLALVLATGALPSRASANTITVNSGGDVLANDGACTLREAVIAANTDTPSGAAPGECPRGAGPDDIVIAVPKVTLAIPGTGLGAQAGDLNLDGPVTISGSGAASTTIDAAGVDRVFEIAPATNVTIRDVTITGGVSANGTDGGAPTMVGGALTGGSATAGAFGGGIDNPGTGVLTLQRAVVTGNRTGRGGNGGDVPATTGLKGHGGFPGVGGFGGGVYSFGPVTITDSAITGNVTGPGGRGGDGRGGSGATGGAPGLDGIGQTGDSGGSGAGIAISTFGSAVISRSSVTNNTTGDGGDGGTGAGGSAVPASGAGAGGGSGTGGGGGSGGLGGGIYIGVGTAVTVQSTLVQGNHTGVGGDGALAAGGGGALAVSAAGGHGGSAIAGEGGIGGVGAGIGDFGKLTATSDTVAQNLTGAGAGGGDAFGGPGGGGSPGGTGGDATGGDAGARGTGAGLDQFGATSGETLTGGTIVGNVNNAISGTPGGATGGFGAQTGAEHPGAAAVPRDGAGLEGSVSLAVTGTILSGNSPANCANVTTQTTLSFPSTDTSCTGALAVDPKLSVLGDHGGPTLTFSLRPGSPAIDHVPAPGCPPTDQRGVARPQGGACDAGAYEVAPPGVVTGGAIPPSAAAGVSGSVNPHTRAASAHFEYGTTTAYGSATPVRAVGAGNIAVTVSEPLTGLRPATTYHYRVVATNADGTARGADRTFTTLAVPLRPPVLSKLALKPGSFRPATKRHPKRGGTSISYRLSTAARTAFTVEVRRSGVRRGKHCVAPPKSKRAAKRLKRCARYVRLRGGLAHTSRKGGAVRFHWNGTLRGRRLAAGSYKLLARPSRGKLRGRLVSRGFRVKR